MIVHVLFVASLLVHVTLLVVVATIAAAVAGWPAVGLVLIVAASVVAGLLAAVPGGPEPDPRELPPIRLPRGGRGIVAVLDEGRPPLCPRCGRRPCECGPDELDHPARRAIRALKRA